MAERGLSKEPIRREVWRTRAGSLSEPTLTRCSPITAERAVRFPSPTKVRPSWPVHSLVAGILFAGALDCGGRRSEPLPSATTGTEDGSMVLGMSNEGGIDAPVDNGSQPPGFVVAPVGVFPGVVDELVRATAVYVNAMCCSSLNESPMDHDCSQEELWVALDSMPRLACLARLAAQDPTVSSGIQRFAVEARKTAACWAEQCAVSGLSNGSNCKPPAEQIPSPDACQFARPQVCLADSLLDGSAFDDKRAYRSTQMCDGIAQCADGTDELNCPPAADGFHCSNVDSRLVPWTALCDGKRDCANGYDEIDCTLIP